MRKKRRIKICLLLSLVFFMLGLGEVKVDAATPLVTEKELTLYEGYKTYQIRPYYVDDEASVSFASSNKSVAKIYKYGTIKPLKKGKTTITITIKQKEKTYTYKVSVTVKTPYIFINNKVENVKIGEKYGFRVQLMGSSTKDEDIQWEVSDEDIASITQEGKTSILTAKKSGKVRVLVRDTKKGKTSVCHVQVTKDSVLFEFINPTKTLWCDVDYKLQVRGNLSSLTWSVSDESIAKITQEGIITGLKQGTVTVSVTDSMTSKTIHSTIQMEEIQETSASELEYSLWGDDIWVKGVKNKEIKQLRIPETIEGNPVCHLEEGVLHGLENLEVIVIPKTVKISNNIFDNLPSLKSVVILNREEAFGAGISGTEGGCRNLEEYVMPYNMEWKFSDYGEVSNFTNLETFVLPNGQKKVLEKVFVQCDNMEIILPENLTEIDNWFTNCKNTKVVIPRSVTYISRYEQATSDSEITIVTPRGSYAESYAKKYNIPYENYYD